MKSSKSFGTLTGQQYPPNSNGQMPQQPQLQQQQHVNSPPTSPICRCRVMYLGSSVPHITKDGLQGIQEPLRELYPDRASLDQGNAGIDSWLSVWSNGILIENVDENGREMKRFFKIEALHYCAAVKYVPQMTAAGEQTSPQTALPNFLPLDSPNARMQQSSGNSHPPIFASILRRTTGVKVLECHAFICKREAAANALVRCCFHAYADTMYAKQIGSDVALSSNGNDGTVGNSSSQHGGTAAPVVTTRKSKSIANLTDADTDAGDYGDSNNRHTNQSQQQNYGTSVTRRKSTTGGDISDTSQSIHSTYNNLQKQRNLSKSMHQLNSPEVAYGRLGELPDSAINSSHSTSHYNLSGRSKQYGNELPPDPFHNPYASRVPSYPPQSILDLQQTNNSGTLLSVKSMAAKSIASTLLRSKKHAKAMSMAQLNQTQQQQVSQHQNERITSFHQPQLLHHQQAATLGGLGSFMTLPPVPPMFLPNMGGLPQMNGSQTMKLPSRHQQQAQLVHGGHMPHINFEAMTPKEMKKLLKKSAKYGIDPSKFSENGLPILPPRLAPMAPLQMQMLPHAPPPHMTHTQPGNSGTLGSHSLYSMDSQLLGCHQDIPDYNSQTLPYGVAGLGLPPPDMSASLGGAGSIHPVKSILVKPNPEFLKSKAGKKWLNELKKTVKEFKKLLPPHLDGLPIVFGPPPIDALEPATGAQPKGNGSLPPPPTFIHSPPTPLLPPPPPTMSMTSAVGVPMMDSNGYYNPHPFYGPNGHASASSTLLRQSPNSQMMQQNYAARENGLVNGQHELDMLHQRAQSQAMYSDPSMLSGHQQQFKSMRTHGPILYSQPTSDMGTFERRPVPYDSYQVLNSRRPRNHMVEQSVISLGDEIEGGENYDSADGEDQSQRQTNSYPHGGNYRSNTEDEENQHDGYYDQVQPTSSMSYQNGQARSKLRHQHQTRTNQSASKLETNSGHDQQLSDEHSGYSSGGIYRRKHLNERAFSHSIQQEHKSNGGSNSDADYSDPGYQRQQQQQHQQQQHQDTNNNRNTNYKQHQAPRAYDNPHQLYQNRAQHVHNASRNHQTPVDELSSRLENQLNMNSFPNPGVRSRM